MRHGINIVNLRTVENVQDWITNGAGNNVYIARETPHHPRSEWCNPYKLKDYGYNRGKVLKLFEQYIVRNKKLVQKLKKKLKGKVLGCWCAPKRCHGEILHKMAGNVPVYQHQVTSDLPVTSSMDSEGIIDKDDDSDTISPIDVYTQDIVVADITEDAPIPIDIGTQDVVGDHADDSPCEDPPSAQPVDVYTQDIFAADENADVPGPTNIFTQDVVGDHADNNRREELPSAQPIDGCAEDSIVEDVDTDGGDESEEVPST